MHRNVGNCVVKVLSLALLTAVTVSPLSLKIVFANSLTNQTETALDGNDTTVASPTSNATENSENIITLLEMTASIIDKGDELLREMNETFHNAGHVTKNVSAQFFSTLPDPWTIKEISPRIVFFQNGRPELELPYDMKPREMALKLEKANFLNVSRLIFITHGFHNNFNAPWMGFFKDDILKVSKIMSFDQTVAVIGWGGGADLLVFRYRQAAANIIPVGKWLGKIITAIKDLKDKLPIYGIGHSLGAHVMGMAGRESKGFERITGLFFSVFFLLPGNFLFEIILVLFSLSRS